VKPSRRTVTRLAGTLAAAGGLLGATAVIAPAAHADPKACRAPYYSSYKGVAIQPCIDYVVNVDGQGYDAWEAEASVVSPQTDIRFYVQVGYSQTRTSPISWDGYAASEVYGPSSIWKYIHPENGFVFIPGGGCFWARAWATDNGQTVVSDVESPPLNRTPSGTADPGGGAGQGRGGSARGGDWRRWWSRARSR
jgi:hypothetical protein